MAYTAYAPLKITLPIHTDNNDFFYSGTNGHFLKASSVCTNQQLTKYALSVTLPDGSWIKSTHTAMIYLQNLPEAALCAHIFTKLQSAALLYLSQICDSVCRVNFTADKVRATLDN